jgi:hypothetical protein
LEKLYELFHEFSMESQLATETRAQRGERAALIDNDPIQNEPNHTLPGS